VIVPRHLLRARSFGLTLLLMGGGGVTLSFSNVPYDVMLERFSRDIAQNPAAYSKRIERATLILDDGGNQDTLRADIDTLRAHSAWRVEGECLEARRLYQQGRLAEARHLIHRNIRGKARVLEQARLLAAVELRAKDTLKAIEAYRIAWEQHAEESDYIDLANLYKGRGRPPEVFLEKGLRLYPQSAGGNRVAFEVYFSAGDPVSLKRAHAISARAADTLWPLGVDWKTLQARALIALKKTDEAESVLLAALEILDGDSRLQGKPGEAYHQQIFLLLEEARAGRKNNGQGR
jgi:tetratricopeptide (TPR) repeat protein